MTWRRSGVHLNYSIVDVFTDAPLRGNPLAVVMDTRGLTTEQMQSIAREFNLSETTFVERRSAEVEQAGGVHVRIFTTQEELPFAGHPTLGTASVLKITAPETVCDGTVTLVLKAGHVPVRFEERGDGAAGLFGEMTQPEPKFGDEMNPAEVAQLLGLTVRDLDPALTPQAVSTGNFFVIVVLRSVTALGRLRVDQVAATAWLRQHGARWFYVIAPVREAERSSTEVYRARMQFYGGEDPATGSAAGCAISYLVARGAVPSDVRIHVRQGVEIGRPSDLFLAAQRADARVRNVRVAGSTVLVAKGQLFLS